MEPAVTASPCDPCPPEWIVRLARLKTVEDDVLLVHVGRCNRCAKVYSGEDHDPPDSV